ncbi:S8 family serine peptidase [Halomonas denitrificans]|nr:S8 family serine peptidase [Halomonas denitrificans]
MKNALLFLVFAQLSGPVTAATPPPDYAPTRFTDSTITLHSENEYSATKPTLNADPPPRFIVKLASPASAQLQYSADAKSLSRSVDPQTHQSQLDHEVAQFRHSLSQSLPDAVITHRFSTLLNGVSVQGKGVSADQLAALPGVKAVYPDRLRSIKTDRSLELIEAERVWQKLGGQAQAGKDVRIAIIDTGIRPENLMFADDGFAEPIGDLPDDDYCRTVDASFCNNKLIVARWFKPTFTLHEDEHLSPLDYGGHGTHVAGTAAGNPIVIEQFDESIGISGVAPGARLMVYKALFANEEGQGKGQDSTLIQALEFALADGADVINNSWGGSPGSNPASSPYPELFDTLEAAGVIVVTAAGNDGNKKKTIGCPACATAGLAVANTTHGRFVAHALSAGSAQNLLAIQGSAKAQLVDDINATITASTQLDADNAEGCSPFSANAFDGQIALITRGTCAFVDKSKHAADAGAIAMVVYNNKQGMPVVMSLDEATIPSVMISQSDGKALLSLLEAQPDLTASLDAQSRRMMAPEFVDNVSQSSSRGPNGNPNVLKPDLAAPGSDILSAFPAEDGESGFAMLSGTSMASPHVAGAAALMRALHPDWSVSAIKTALTSSAKFEGLMQEDSVTPATPFDVGAGRLDMAAASEVELTFSQPSFASTNCVTRCQFRATATNQSDEQQSWALQAVLEGAEAVLSPETLSLAPGASAEFILDINARALARDDWHFGRVTFTGNRRAQLPIALAPTWFSQKTQTELGGNPPSLTYGEIGEFYALFRNAGFDGDMAISLQLDKQLSFEPDSVHADVTNGHETAFSVDNEAREANWGGTLDPEIITIRSNGQGPFTSKASDDNRLACGEDCDEIKLVFQDLPEFELNGETHTSLTLSSNGLIAAGDADTNSAYLNQKLPNPAEPNNLIAPFWTDLDLEGNGTDMDTGGGTLHHYIEDDGNGNPIWLVFDWIDAQVYFQFEGRYSFGVRLGIGANIGHTVISYYSMDSMPEEVTIGAEGKTGLIGSNYFYNGEGNVPGQGEVLLVQSQAGGEVTFDFALNSNALNVAADDIAQLDEDSSIEIPVGENDDAALLLPILLSAVHDGEAIEHLHQVPVEGPQPSAIKVATQPRHGSADVVEGLTVAYTPDADFAGTDEFSYDALSDAGEVIGSAKVQVQVTQVNDAPTITAIPLQKVNSGRSLSLTLPATDPEDDALTFTVTQTAGAEASLVLAGDQLTIKAPKVGDTETLSFEVVATDGELESEPASFDLKVVKRHGGSLGWVWLALVSLLLMQRQRRPS